MNREKLSMKNLTVILCVAVPVILFAVMAIFGVRIIKTDKTVTDNGSIESTLPVSQSRPAEITSQESTAQQTTEQITTTVPTTIITTTAVTTTLAPIQPPVTEPPTSVQPTESVPSDEEILKLITDGINSIKASDASYVGTKTQNIVIDVTDCSYPAFLTIINSVVKLIANEEVLKYDFTNGKCIDPEENVQVTANDTIPPVGTAFALTMEGVREASYEKVGDNTVCSVTLVPETGTFDQPKPPHHGVACDTLDFSLFEIPMGEITKSDFNYPGATITVTYDKDGKVVGYSEHIDMNGVGEGQALGISASASMQGYIDESWQIVWK